MYSSEDEDLERFYFQYQTEALSHGEFLQSFCVNQMIKSIIYLLKTGDSDRNREKDDYTGFTVYQTIFQGISQLIAHFHRQLFDFIQE